MPNTSFRTALVALGLLLFNQVTAQAQGVTVATNITFTMPVNLTQLHPDLVKVKFFCAITSSALTYPLGTNPFNQNPLPPPVDEVWVTNGQVVNTMRVVVPIAKEWLNNPIGKTADYTCVLVGFSKSLNRWDGFSETATDPVFYLKPAPPVIQRSFVW